MTLSLAAPPRDVRAQVLAGTTEPLTFPPEAEREWVRCRCPDRGVPQIYCTPAAMSRSREELIVARRKGGPLGELARLILVTRARRRREFEKQRGYVLPAGALVEEAGGEPRGSRASIQWSIVPGALMTLAAAAELELPEFSDLAFDWFADHLPDDLGPLEITEGEDPSSIVGFISFDEGNGFAAGREALVEFVVDRSLPEFTEWMRRETRTRDFAARIEVAKALNR